MVKNGKPFSLPICGLSSLVNNFYLPLLTGVVWLWDEGSNLYGFNPTSTNVTPIKLPEMCQSSRPLCLGAAPEALWLLTESGRIAIRKDITALNATGSTWIELDLMQIGKFYVKIGRNGGGDISLSRSYTFRVRYVQ